MQSAFAEYYCADNGCPNVPNRTNGWDDAVEEHLQPERRGCCDKEKIYSLHEPATECISKGEGVLFENENQYAFYIRLSRRLQNRGWAG